MIICLAMCLALIPSAAFAAEETIKVTVKETDITADSAGNTEGYGTVRINENIDPNTGDVISAPKAALIGKDGSFLFNYSDTWLRYYYDAASGIVSLSNSNYRTRYTLGSFMDENSVPDAPRFFTLDGKTAFTVDSCSGSPMRDGYAIVLNQTEDYEFALHVVDAKGSKVYTFPEKYVNLMGGAGDYYFEEFGFTHSLTWTGEGLVGFGSWVNEDADGFDGYYFDKYKVEGYMDMTGKTVITLDGYSDMGPFADGLAFVADSNTGLFGFIDKTGRLVIPCRYEAVGTFSGGYAFVRQNGLYGYIDKTGKLVIPCEYDAAYGAGSGLFSVGKAGRFGLVDASNKVVVPLEYDDISSCENGAAYAVKNRKVSIITIAKEEAPQPVAPVKPEPRTVKLSPQKFMVNGQNVDCEKYNIDGSNYFKLRDLAMVLNGTSKQFSVGWDAASRTVSIETGKAYTPEGGELTPGSGKPQTAVVSTQTIMIDGQKVSDISVYNIGGNNYFKLRDLGSKVGFIVDYDEATNTAIVKSEDGGDAEEVKPEPAPKPEITPEYDENPRELIVNELMSMANSNSAIKSAAQSIFGDSVQLLIYLKEPSDYLISVTISKDLSTARCYLHAGFGLADGWIDSEELPTTDLPAIIRWIENHL